MCVGWMNKLLNGWVDGQVDSQIYEWMGDGWMDTLVNAWIDG